MIGIVGVSLFKEMKILYLGDHDCRLIMDPDLWLKWPLNSCTSSSNEDQLGGGMAMLIWKTYFGLPVNVRLLSYFL
jgi:hypothetical protein